MPDEPPSAYEELIAKISAQVERDDHTPTTPDPPDWFTQQCPDDYHIGVQQIADDDEIAAQAKRDQHRMLDLSALSRVEPPIFPWFDPGWLSPHPTLLSGRGGVGKSLLGLQILIARAAGIPFLTEHRAPRQKCLYWACEDDADELHRRIARCCRHMGVDMASLEGWLHVDCRLGLDNILMSVEFGRPMWAPAYGLLQEQLNDLGAEIWVGDNIAHMYAGSENDRTPVTVFAAGIAAARRVQYCPLLLGHVAKAQGSEYAGSTAWENSMRMRLFLGRKLPDQPDRDDDGNGGALNDSLRVLAKRKANYSADDIIEFRIEDGVLIRQVPEGEGVSGGEGGGGGGALASIRRKKAREAILVALEKIGTMGLVASEKTGSNYLPALMERYELMGGYSKRDIIRAMHDMLRDGEIRRGPAGRDKARRDKIGLVVVGEGGPPPVT